MAMYLRQQFCDPLLLHVSCSEAASERQFAELRVSQNPGSLTTLCGFQGNPTNCELEHKCFDRISVRNPIDLNIKAWESLYSAISENVFATIGRSESPAAVRSNVSTDGESGIPLKSITNAPKLEQKPGVIPRKRSISSEGMGIDLKRIKMEILDSSDSLSTASAPVMDTSDEPKLMEEGSGLPTAEVAVPENEQSPNTSSDAIQVPKDIEIIAPVNVNMPSVPRVSSDVTLHQDDTVGQSSLATAYATNATGAPKKAKDVRDACQNTRDTPCSSGHGFSQDLSLPSPFHYDQDQTTSDDEPPARFTISPENKKNVDNEPRKPIYTMETERTVPARLVFGSEEPNVAETQKCSKVAECPSTSTQNATSNVAKKRKMILIPTETAVGRIDPRIAGSAVYNEKSVYFVRYKKNHDIPTCPDLIKLLKNMPPQSEDMEESTTPEPSTNEETPNDELLSAGPHTPKESPPVDEVSSVPAEPVSSQLIPPPAAPEATYPGPNQYCPDPQMMMYPYPPPGGYPAWTGYEAYYQGPPTVQGPNMLIPHPSFYPYPDFTMIHRSELLYHPNGAPTHLLLWKMENFYDHVMKYKKDPMMTRNEWMMTYARTS